MVVEVDISLTKGFPMITQENQRPRPDEALISQLKKKKLRIKEDLAQIG